MKTSDLAQALEQPEIHKRILRGYAGAYTLGVTNSPDNDEGAAFLLRVGEEAPLEISDNIEINGETVPIVVKRGFKAPKAQ